MKNILFVMLLALQVGFAQQKIQIDTAAVENLNEVVITANRGKAKRSEVPMAISKLSTKLIQETKATSAFEIVNKTPGVMMTNLGNEQHGMSIRQPMGLSPYYLYLEDGLPIRPLGVFNHNALLEMNPFNLQNLEVIKGPASSLYGPEAVGGTVNFITVKPSRDPEFKVGIQADQYGYRNLQAFGSATVGKFSFAISGVSTDQTNSWLTFSDYNKNNLNAKFQYNFSNSLRLISSTFYSQYYSDMTGSVNEQDFKSRSYKSTTDFTYRKSEALRSRLTLEKEWSENSQTVVTVYHRDNKLGQNPSYGIRWNPTPSATNDPTKATGEINSNDFKSYGIVAQHTQGFSFLNSKLIAGTTYDRSPNDYFSHQIKLQANRNPDGKTVNKYQILEVRPDLRISNYNATIYNNSGYVQYNFQPLSKVTVTTGARYDYIKIDYTNNINASSGAKTYDQLTFKAGINYNPLTNVGLYANYSQGFSPPSVTTLFRPKPGVTPVQFYTDLDAAHFSNYEIGGYSNLLKNKLTLDFALYVLDGRNELLSIRQPDNSTDTQSAGKTSHRGIELGLQYNPSSQLAFRLGGTYARHEFIDFTVSKRSTDAVQKLDGFDMPSAPRWIANSELNYYPKWFPNFRAALECQYVSSWFQNQINTVSYAGYTLFNARLGYRYKQVEFFTNIMNLTDKLYATNVSRGNATIDQATYTAAAPRIFMMGLQYNLSLKK
ncbi:TonB-dependent receptor [Flavobacterium sp. SOK18b]|uniref:TonB-dependent receptor n=1 Tax=Flavobacterium sp. SOK18b TaxID=797900 RepID=UPI0015F915DC|nr:TonB-dependent receptor [Flavobacterium sp. SOK18b]MBB1193284.1 TonB-dependent receptor [Flavobacterium sp. SOK18b]